VKYVLDGWLQGDTDVISISGVISLANRIRIIIWIAGPPPASVA